MKEPGVKSMAESFDSKALYDNMLKILDRFLLEKLEEKQAKILDIELEKRLEILKKFFVHNAGIDSLEFQQINCKDFRFQQVHKQMYCNTQLVIDDFVNILSKACKDDLDVHFLPSMTYKNVVEATLVFHDEVEQKKVQDESTWKKNESRYVICLGRSDLFDVKMDSSSSSEIVTQVAQRKLKPEWLEKFFERTFFDPCPKHPIRKNDLNKYCIDCDAALCQYCLILSPHSGHRLLKIYRHVYKDVVPFVQIVRHIDCTKIQPYRCNRQMVIALSPLPHTGSGKTSKEATCITCKRKLIECDIYKYCSITCKVEAFKKKQSDSAPPFLLLDRKEENTEAESSTKKIRKRAEQNTEAESSSKKARRRKGTPHRAPFF